MRLREGLLRQAETATFENENKAVRFYAQRLVRDLEGKGTIRTSLEAIHLAVNIDLNDVLNAECIVTCPSVSLLATMLLRREEVET